jgi:hypothetical protein
MSELNITYRGTKSSLIWDPSASLLGSYAKIPPGDRVPDFILSNGSRFYHLLTEGTHPKHAFTLLLLLNSSTVSPNSSPYKTAERFALQLHHRYLQLSFC